MKIPAKGVLYFFVFSVAIVFSSGCATTRVNLVDKGVISIERLPSKMVYVSSAFAYKEGDTLIISGKVKRKSTRVTSGGHVDIGVFSPEGKITKEVSTAYFPGIIRRKGSRESSFTARIPGVPAQGSRVKVAYHGLDLSSNTFDCGSNVVAKR